jgi:hypothetical protein
VYVPYLVLRDAWHISKYVNLNKFQISVQNIDRVDEKRSDAYKHAYPYTFAITMMGSPIFFQETHYYSDEAVAQLKPVIATYKKHRSEMFDGYVFPIGDEPDNASWTGFQNYNDETEVSYLTILRELENKAGKKKIKLKFLNGKKIEYTNLMTGESFKTKVSENGEIEFEINNPSDFLFLKAHVLD